MFKVEKGQEISLAEAKSGESSKGIWMFVPVKAERGYDSVTLWVANAEEARYFTGNAKVKEILNVSINNTQNKDKTKWFKQFCASVILDGKNERKATANKGLSAFDEFLSIPEDDSLPFN